MTQAAREATASGEMARYPFPRLLYYLYKKAFLGELEIQPPADGPMRIFFRDGIPVRADLPGTQDVLGRLLLERGWITEEQYQRSLAAMAAGEGKLQGNILVSMGALEVPRLIEALVLQLRRKLYRFFHAVEGTFALFAGEHPHGVQAEAAYVRADPLFVIYQGVRNALTPQRLARELERLDAMAVGLRPEFQKVRERYGFSDDDAPLIEMLDRGLMPVEHVFSVSHLGPVQTQMLLYSLWVTEVLVAKPADTVQASAPPPADPASVLPNRAAGPPAAAPPASLLTGRQQALAPQPGPQGTAKLPAIEVEAGGAAPSSPPLAPRKRQPSQDVSKVQATVEEAFAKLPDQNYFEVLGLTREASADVIREAYFKLAKCFHPDRITGYGVAGLTEKAQEIFRRINEANSVLTDAEKRRAYEDKLEGKTGEDESARIAAEAEFAFQKGIVHFRKHAFAAAREELARAVELNPKEGEHLAWLAWAMYSDPKADRAKELPKVKQQLLEAMKLSPKSAVCHYYLGEIYVALDDPKRALTCFNKVLEIDPKHIGAQRHLRLIQMRKDRVDKGGGGKGFFGRLRKK